KEQMRRCQFFPPLAQNIKITAAMKSEETRRVERKVERATGTKKSSEPKLVYDLNPKDYYVIWSSMLKFLLENDLITLDAVYGYVKMDAGYVMRPYIQEMT